MRVLSLVGAVVSALLSGEAGAAETRWPTAAANEYWHLREERDRAHAARDRAFYEKLLAPDFVLLATNGQFLGREEFLASEFSGGAAGAKTVSEFTGFEARHTGDTLVLTYEEREVTTLETQEFVQHMRRMDVYVRRGDGWMLQSMAAAMVPEAPAPVALSADDLKVYEGTYEFSEGVRSRVWLDGAKLREQTTGSPETELIPIGPDAFYAPPDLVARVTFEREGGRVVAQVYRSGSQVVRGRRVE